MPGLIGKKVGMTSIYGASGKNIPNLGERRCEVFAEGYDNSLLMNFQVADVHRPLLSLSKATGQGFRSCLDYYGGYLEDTTTGECIPIQRRGNLYVMQIWVRAGPDEQKPVGFSWPG